MVGLNKSLNYIYVKTPIFQYKYRSIRMPDMRIYVYMTIFIYVYTDVLFTLAMYAILCLSILYYRLLIRAGPLQ